MKDQQINKIGLNIKNKRKEIGMSQEKLAELSKLSVNYISRLERSTSSNLSVNALVSISSALKVDINELINPRSAFTLSNNLQRLNELISELDTEKADDVVKILIDLINKLK